MIYPLDAVSVVCFIILIAKRQETLLNLILRLL